MTGRAPRPLLRLASSPPAAAMKMTSGDDYCVGGGSHAGIWRNSKVREFITLAGPRVPRRALRPVCAAGQPRQGPRSAHAWRAGNPTRSRRSCTSRWRSAVATRDNRGGRIATAAGSALCLRTVEGRGGRHQRATRNPAQLPHTQCDGRRCGALPQLRLAAGTARAEFPSVLSP
jgi:hypothetical protein